MQRAAQAAALDVLVHGFGLLQGLLQQRQRQRVVARTELLQALGEGARQFLGGDLLGFELRVQLADGGEEDVVADVRHGQPQAWNWKAGSVLMGNSWRRQSVGVGLQARRARPSVRRRDRKARQSGQPQRRPEQRYRRVRDA